MLLDRSEPTAEGYLLCDDLPLGLADSVLADSGLVAVFATTPATDPSPRRALVLMPCGATKQESEAQAQHLYLGPMWQSYRAAMNELDAHWVKDRMDLAIISAEHGLVPATSSVAPYERQLTEERMPELRNQLQEQVRTHLGAAHTEYAFVVVAGGARYRELAKEVFRHLKALGSLTLDAILLEVSGAIGMQRQRLKRVIKGMPDLLSLPARPASRWDAQANLRKAQDDLAREALACVKVPGKVGTAHLPGLLTWIATRPSMHAAYKARLRRIQADRTERMEALSLELSCAYLVEEFSPAHHDAVAAPRLTAHQRRLVDLAEDLLTQLPERTLLRVANDLALPKRGGRFVGSPFLALGRAVYRRPAEVLRALQAAAE